MPTWERLRVQGEWHLLRTDVSVQALVDTRRPLGFERYEIIRFIPPPLVLSPLLPPRAYAVGE